MATDYAIHSDFLIHWTGKDLDKYYDRQWGENERSKIDKKNNPALLDAYVTRLRNTLRYGLWLTEEAPEQCSSESM